jgi:2-keto-4-pentenoate hydratase/2-oxohepta-3-ene-1,7-dioic acid hydratase in catechol pathway
MKAQVTISRASDDLIRIKFQDCNSRIEFAEVAMSAADFANALTGLAHQEADLKVRGLNNVGKVLVSEKRKITCLGSNYDRKYLKEWLRDNAKEEGWLVDDYLGSQGSVAYHNGETILNYWVYKYVDPEVAT